MSFVILFCHVMNWQVLDMLIHTAEALNSAQAEIEYRKALKRQALTYEVRVRKVKSRCEHRNV